MDALHCSKPMPDSFEDQEWVKLGVASALQNELNRDQRDFLPLVAMTFEKALPAETTIKSKGIFKKTVVGMTVTLGDYRYELEDVGTGALVAKRIKIVRGIALKTESIDVPTLLEELVLAVQMQLGSSQAARAALSSMLGLP